MIDHELFICLIQGNATEREQAFAEVVTRHGHWMYAAAMRMVGDTHAAEDVVQAAFIILAKKAHKLGGDVRLTSWLAGVVRMAARRARRDIARQRYHETQVHMNTSLREEPDPADYAAWNEIAPLLDTAVATLSPIDREAILLRYYRQLSFVDVGANLGLSEEAARKRVERALKQLQPMLTRSGASVGMSVASLAAVLSAHATLPAAPAGLIGAATTLGLATKASGAVVGSAGGIADGVNSAMLLARLKIAAALLTILLVGGTLAAIVGKTWLFAPAPSPIVQIPGPTPAIVHVADIAKVNVPAPHGELMNGVQVTFLGTGESPSGGRPWYAPDGSLLATPQFPDRGGSFRGVGDEVAHEYVFTYHAGVVGSANPATIIFPYPSDPRDEGTPADSTQTAIPSLPIPDDLSAAQRLDVLAYDHPGKTIRLHFLVAAGQWTTRLQSTPDHDVSMTGGDDFWDTWFARPTEHMGMAATFLTQKVGWARLDRRIVAIDTAGNIYETKLAGPNQGDNGFYEYGELAAPRLPLSKLSRFELQTRSFDQWIEFRNISTDPAHATAVEVRTSDDQTLKARLLSGTTVTLLGVSDNTDVSKRWWNANGSPLTAPPYARIPNRLGAANAFELPFFVTGTDAQGKPWTALNMKWSASNGRLGLVGRSDRGRRLPGEYVLLGQHSLDVQTTTLTLSFAAQPYKIGVKLPVDGITTTVEMNIPGLGHAHLSNLREIDGHATVTATVPNPPAGMSVIVTAVHGRQAMPPVSSPLISDGLPHDVSFSAPLKSDKTSGGVDAFEIQTRDESHSVEFKDIALSPEVHSTPTVVIHN